jgi:Na+-driven multidrug efflux pump
VTVIMALGYATRLYTAFGRVRPSVCLRLLGTAPRIAIPAVLTNLAAPLGTAIVTREMAKFGPEAVAGMAIVGRLTPVAFAVVIATSGAIGPIVGQNLGAGFLKRIQTTILNGLLFILLYVLAMSGVLFLLNDLIADLFQANGDARLLVLLFCGPLSLMQLFNGAVSLAGATFENLGHPAYSTLINWGRNTIGTLPFVMIGAAYYGPQGILIGQALGGVLFGILAVVCAMYLLYRPARRIRKFGFNRNEMMQDLAYFGRG